MSFPIKFNENILTNPSPVISLQTGVRDVKAVAEAKYAETVKQLSYLKNVKTNQIPVGIEQLNILVDKVGEQAVSLVETKVDDYVYKESGYHLSEINHMLSKGNRIWSVLKEMQTSEKLPDPEWIVNSINAIAKMSKTDNPRILELQADLNSKWKLYKESKSKIDVLSKHKSSTDSSSNAPKTDSKDLNRENDSSVKETKKTSLEAEETQNKSVSAFQKLKNDASAKISNVMADASSRLTGFINDVASNVLSYATDSYSNLFNFAISSSQTIAADSSSYINDVINQSTKLYNRWAGDVTAFENMFKDVSTCKSYVQALLEAWLSDQSQILCNAFMVNKFKGIIEHIRKVAKEGFKKDPSTSYTEISAGIEIFESVKSLLYSLDNIKVADSYEDMFNIDTSKADALYNKAKTTVLNAKDSVVNTATKTWSDIKNQTDVIKNSVSRLSSNLENNFNSLSGHISEINDSLSAFMSEEHFNNITKSLESVCTDFAKASNISPNELFSYIDLKAVAKNIQTKTAASVTKAIKEKNKDILDSTDADASTGIDSSINKEEPVKDSSSFISIDTSVGILGYNIAVKLDVNIDFQKIVSEVWESELAGIENKIINNLSVLGGSLQTMADLEMRNLTALAKNGAGTIGKDINNIANGLMNDVHSTELTLMNTEKRLLNNANLIAATLMNSAQKLTMVLEQATDLNNLFPSIQFKAPPFISIFLNWLSILKPIMDTLSILVRNYRTNKMMTRQGAWDKISKIKWKRFFKDGFQIREFGENLVEIKETYKSVFVKENIANNPDYIISKSNEGVTLNSEGTNLLAEYLGDKSLVGKNAFVVFNDNDQFICEGDENTGTIFIKDKTDALPATPSLVMEYAPQPEYIPFDEEDLSDSYITPEMTANVGISEENDETDSSGKENAISEFLEAIKEIRKDLKVETDEFEGLQVIQLDEVDLCDNDRPLNFHNPDLPNPGVPSSVDDIDPEKITEQPVIIEFAREDLHNDGIDFELLVKPGEYIFEGQNLAIITKDGISKTVKSIYKSGRVRKRREPDEDGNDLFAQTYNDERNIVIDHPVMGEGLIEQEEVENLQKEFNEENELYDLITKHLLYSIYPDILVDAEPKKQTLEKLNSPLVEGLVTLPTAETVYDRIIDHFTETEENFNEKIIGQKKISKKEAKTVGQKFADKIKAENGKQSAIEQIGNEVIENRKKYIIGNHLWESKQWGVIDLYENYKEKCSGYSKSRILTDDLTDLTAHIGISYYLGIYKDITEESEWADEYKSILENIINIRRISEKEPFEDIIKFFNMEAFESSDDNALTGIEGNDLWKHLQSKWDDISDIPEYDDFYEFLSVNAKNENTSYEFFKKLYNLYIYIRKNTDEILEDWKTEEDFSLDQLIINENAQIKDFWERAIGRYKEVEISKQIDKLYEAESVAEWPESIDLKLAGNRKTYTFYLFKNWLTDEPVLPDEPMPENVEYNEIDLDSWEPDISTAEEDFKQVDNVENLTTIDARNIKYWKRWCSQVTLANCVMGPGAWATGLILKGIYIQFPCVLIPIKVVNIKSVNLSIVIGISIRLTAIQPMIIYVNPTNEISSLVPALNVLLKKFEKKYKKYIRYAEYINMNTIQILINAFEEENKRLLKKNRELEIQADSIKSLYPRNWNTIRKDMLKMAGRTSMGQAVYRIASYPKDSDFNKNIHLKIGEGSVFGEHEFSLDMNEFTPIADIESAIKNIITEGTSVSDDASTGMIQ